MLLTLTVFCISFFPFNVALKCNICPPYFPFLFVAILGTYSFPISTVFIEMSLRMLAGISLLVEEISRHAIYNYFSKTHQRKKSLTLYGKYERIYPKGTIFYTLLPQLFLTVISNPGKYLQWWKSHSLNLI